MQALVSTGGLSPAPGSHSGILSSDPACPGKISRNKIGKVRRLRCEANGMRERGKFLE